MDSGLTSNVAALLQIMAQQSNTWQATAWHSDGKINAALISHKGSIYSILMKDFVLHKQIEIRKKT